jgi:hypothetical protein
VDIGFICLMVVSNPSINDSTMVVGLNIHLLLSCTKKKPTFLLIKPKRRRIKKFHSVGPRTNMWVAPTSFDPYSLENGIAFHLRLSARSVRCSVASGIWGILLRVLRRGRKTVRN